MPMPGRTVENTWSRHGFNGQAKDDEVYGKGNLNTALFWEYDTRLGPNGRWNIDPVTNPSVSPYATFEGNPIWRNDLLGNSPNEYTVDERKGTVTQTGTKGGDKTDYITFKNTPLRRNDPMDKRTLPDQTLTVPVKNTYAADGQGVGHQTRLPGAIQHTIPSPGTATMVDDPLTSIGPSLIRGALMKVAAKVTASAATEFNASSFADEIVTINKTTDGGGVLLNGTPSSAINSAMYYETPAEQGAAIFRSISHGHMFANGNKRTAVAVFESFAKQQGLKTVSQQQMMNVSTQVATGQITDVSQIAKMLTK